MSKIVQQIAYGTTRLTLLVLTASLTVSRANVIQPTVELVPASGEYSFGTFCLASLGRCTQNATVSGFSNLTHTQDNGNELVTADAIYSAGIYLDNSGVPGAFLGNLSMPGFVTITYVGRNPSLNPLGAFTTLLTDFNFLGSLNGNSFEVKQNPGQPSTGLTTINQYTFAPPILYSVSSTMSIFALYSFNGAPFEAAPERTATLTAVPEPASTGLAAAALVGLWAMARCRSRTTRA